MEVKKKTNKYLDPDLRHDEDYFYQFISDSQISQIRVFINDYFEGIKTEHDFEGFVKAHPKLKKSEANLNKVWEV